MNLNQLLTQREINIDKQKVRDTHDVYQVINTTGANFRVSPTESSTLIMTLPLNFTFIRIDNVLYSDTTTTTNDASNITSTFFRARISYDPVLEGFVTAQNVVSNGLLPPTLVYNYLVAKTATAIQQQIILESHYGKSSLQDESNNLSIVETSLSDKEIYNAKNKRLTKLNDTSFTEGPMNLKHLCKDKKKRHHN